MDVKAAILNERGLVLCHLPSCFVSGARLLIAILLQNCVASLYPSSAF